MRRRVSVIGCTPPSRSPRPGSVTSMAPARSSPSIARRSSSIRRVSIALCSVCLALLIRAQSAGRSDADSVPRALSCSVKVPLRPSHWTRISSGPATLPLAATCASALSIRAPSSPTAPAPKPSGCSETDLGALGDDAEGISVIHRQIRQQLAIDLQTRLVQSGDQTAVRQAVNARRGIDARDPERAKVALLGAPVAIRILAGLDDRLLGGAINFAPRVVITLGFAEDLLMTASGRHATFDSCHDGFPLFVIRQQLFQATDVALTHQTAAARTQMTLALGILVAKVMAAGSRVPLEAIRSLAKTLRGGPVGFQLGHDITPHCCQSSQGSSVNSNPLARGSPGSARQGRARMITSFLVQTASPFAGLP